MTRTRRVLGLAAWVLALVGVVLVLWVSGRGPLRLPPVGDASAWRRWLAEGDATTVAFALVRMLALGAAGYCLVVTAVGGGARLVRAGTIVALVDRVTVPPLRRLLSVTLSAGLATGLATGLAGAGVAAATSPTTVTSGPAVTLTMHRLPPAAPGTASPTTGPPATARPTTTTTTMPSAPTTTTTVEPAPASPPASDAVPSSSAGPSSPADRWTVRPGDCFWSIAADVLARASGRPAVDAEIAPYWRRLVEANRGALADASNPDLVFPGQVFTLPPP